MTREPFFRAPALVSSAAFLVLTALAGCGPAVNQAASGAGGGGQGGAGGAGAGGGASALAKSCASYAATECPWLSKCLPYGFSVTYAGESDCETRVELDCEQTYGTGAKGSMVTPGQVAKCAAAESAAACDLFGPPPAACRFTGSLPAGAGCFDDAQCETGFCWLKYSCENGQCPIPTCGVCLAPKPPGESCQPGQCEIGSTCSSQELCVKGKPTGAACDAEHLCNEADYCNEHQVCAPFRKLGDPCPLGFECDVNAGASCDLGTHECIAIPVLKLGETCAGVPTGEIQPHCGPGAYCSSPDHVCKARKADGGNCAIDAEGGDIECEPPDHCISGKCTVDAPTCP